LSSCEVCREGYKSLSSKKGKEPPCEKCKPELIKENEEALKIYVICQNQVLMSGFGDIVDLNYNALEFIMSLYNVKNKRECFEKIIKIFRYIQENKPIK
jgi:hypothetical protein